MKKLIALLLVAVMALSMVACGNKTADNKETTGAGSQEQAGLSGTAEEITIKLIEKNPIAFMGGLIPVDLTDTSEDGLWALKSFTGMDSAEKLKEVAVYEPMTGSQAFSLVVVRVKEAADAKSVAEQMKENIDPRKWICVGADQVMAAGCGDVVMFIMVDSQLGKTAQSYVDAFTSLCGGKVDFTI